MNPVMLFFFSLASLWLFYSFYKSYANDPGYLCNARDEQFAVRI